MHRFIKITHKFGQIKQNRNLITPELFTKQAFEQFQLINSNNFTFLIKQNLPQNIMYIYEHFIDSPSNLLKKEAIHIFPQNIPPLSVEEKYQAHIKRIMKRYESTLNKCKTPAELFHMERKAKSNMKNQCRFIGQISDRYKHYNVFQSIDQLKAKKTASQYLSKGIKVQQLPFANQEKKIIYPKGPIWLPTNPDYLEMFIEYLSKSNIVTKISHGNILDVGCGSGVLSYILAHKFKSKDVKVFALDNNPYAVQTVKINSASFGLRNIVSFEHNINKKEDLQSNFKQNKIPSNFSLIVCNPPWIHAKKMRNQSQILNGVYDQDGKFLKSILEMSKKLLQSPESRLLLIYSDISQILGLQKQNISEICVDNNLIVHQKIQIPYSKTFNKQSVLNPFKAKSKLQLFQIGKS